MLATFWNTVAWTLSCEAAFYFAFPWIIRLPWPKTRAWSRFCSESGRWGWSRTRSISTSIPTTSPALLTATRQACGFARLSTRRSPTPAPSSRESPSPSCRGPWSLAPRQRTLVAGASLAAIALFFAKAVAHVPYILMHGGFLVPLFAALVIGLSGQNIFASIFAWKPIELVGQASYALFLLHFNFINLLRNHQVSERLHLAAFDPWLSYAAALLLAIAAMYFVNVPRAVPSCNAAPPSSPAGSRAGKCKTLQCVGQSISHPIRNTPPLRVQPESSACSCATLRRHPVAPQADRPRSRYSTPLLARICEG